MQGIRMRVVLGEEDFVLRISETPGAYGSVNGADWFCTTPNGLLGTLCKHTVVEHDDGTITVSPSILVTGGGSEEGWHGFLERGVWRSC